MRVLHGGCCQYVSVCVSVGIDGGVCVCIHMQLYIGSIGFFLFAPFYVCWFLFFLCSYERVCACACACVHVCVNVYVSLLMCLRCVRVAISST